MKSFNERNPVTVAVVGIIACVVVFAAAFSWKHLPFVASGTRYHANFAEAAGLQSGADVTVAGVTVGTVSRVALDGAHVRVDFTVRHTWIGDASTVAIGIKTLLGDKYLAVDPLGTRAQAPGDVIPERRTSAPYDVSTALQGLGSDLGHIDSTRLARSFALLANTFRHTPAAVRVSLHGLDRLSQTVASRDRALTMLLHNARQVSQTLADDDPSVNALLRDGNILLGELRSRSDAITTLLTGTQRLSVQLTGLVRDNDATLNPALAQLDRVTTILSDNQTNLSNALRLLGPYYTLLDDAVGNGRWIDVYLCGLFTATGTPQLRANAVRNCTPPGSGG